MYIVQCKINVQSINGRNLMFYSYTYYEGRLIFFMGNYILKSFSCNVLENTTGEVLYNTYRKFIKKGEYKFLRTIKLFICIATIISYILPKTKKNKNRI